MHVTVEERDQYETLRADWSPNYDFSYDTDRDHPYHAVPHANGKTVLAADTPAELRDYVRVDHAMRTAGARITLADSPATEGSP
jgi:hypothetical protein